MDHKGAEALEGDACVSRLGVSKACGEFPLLFPPKPIFFLSVLTAWVFHAAQTGSSNDERTLMELVAPKKRKKSEAWTLGNCSERILHSVGVDLVSLECQ